MKAIWDLMAVCGPERTLHCSAPIDHHHFHQWDPQHECLIIVSIEAKTLANFRLFADDFLGSSLTGPGLWALPFIHSWRQPNPTGKIRSRDKESHKKVCGMCGGGTAKPVWLLTPSTGELWTENRELGCGTRDSGFGIRELEIEKQDEDALVFKAGEVSASQIDRQRQSKRFWRFVIDKSGQSGKKGMPNAGFFSQKRGPSVPEPCLNPSSLFPLPCSQFPVSSSKSGPKTGRKDGIRPLCVALLLSRLTSGVQSKLIHTLPIHCWNDKTYICKLFLTN